jgi:glycosyltransferase involved in cell wall biosynthesis
MTVVSAVVPVFNRAGTVGRAIDSILAQRMPATGATLEVTVVDDGSTDNLSDALASYGDRVTLIQHERNLGAAAARNSGVAVARGDYIAFLDSDDVWLPGKIDAQLRIMRTESWKASCTAYHLVRLGAREIVSPRFGTRALGLSDLVWGCFVSPGSTLMFERSLFNEVGPLDTALLRLEDWDWLLRYTGVHALGFLAEPLARVYLAPNAHGREVLAAIARLKKKYSTVLRPREWHDFLAALEIERAAAHIRAGNMRAGILPLLRSLWLAPFGNIALSAILHNRLTRKSHL